MLHNIQSVMVYYVLCDCRLPNAITTLRDCKKDLQKALECHGLMSVSH